MKKLIFIDACMRAGSRTQRIATPIIEELSKRYNVETVDLTKNLYPVANNYTLIKALSHLWGWGDLTVISAQNMDYSSPEEIEERVSKAIAEGLEVCKEF